MIKRITDNGTLIAIVGSFEDAGWGNNFITEPNLPMQLGVLRMNKEKIKDHIHKIRNRQCKSISNEFHLVLRGKVLVKLYNIEQKLIDKIVLSTNMFCALYNGGHGYEILKEDTLMIEIKMGEYTNKVDDKILVGE